MFKEIIKNSGIYTIISIFSQGLVFLLWIMLAWWLAPSQLGIYALVMFVIEFFSAISIFGLDLGLTRFYYTKESTSSILSNALIIFLCVSFLSLSLFFFTVKWIPFFITGLSDILEKNLFLFLAIIFANSGANFVFVHYTALKKSASFAKIQIFRILFFFFLSLAFVYFGFGILGVFYGLLFSSLLVLILFIVGERKIISFQVLSYQNIRKMISYSSPLMICAILAIIAGYFGRLLLERYADLTTLGVYNFFLMLTLQVNGLWGTFNRAWTPGIFAIFSENRKQALENIKFLAFFTSFVYLLGLALFIIVGELFLFKLLFKDIYLSHVYIFYLLLLGPLFTGIYTAAYPLYYYENKTKKILFIFLLISGIGIFLNLFMVKYLSQTGAAISYSVLIILSTLIHLFAFRKKMEIPPKIISWTVLLSILTILVFLFFLKTPSSFIFLIFVILGTVLSYKIGNLSKNIPSLFRIKKLFNK